MRISRNYGGRQDTEKSPFGANSLANALLEALNPKPLDEDWLPVDDPLYCSLLRICFSFLL